MLCSFKLLFTQSRFMSLQKKYAESIKSRSISCLWFMDFIRKHCKCLFAIFNIAHITKLLVTTTHFSHFVWNQNMKLASGQIRVLSITAYYLAFKAEHNFTTNTRHNGFAFKHSPPNIQDIRWKCCEPNNYFGTIKRSKIAENL